MTDQPSLFPDIVPAATVDDPTAGMSADARRTHRQRQRIAAGIHPLNGLKAMPDLGTCGDCLHRQVRGHHNRTYGKCDLGPITHGAATDVRRWWPACPRFEKGL